MCLSTVDKKEVTEKIKDTIPEEGLTVYKLVRKYRYSRYDEDKRYYPLYQYMSIRFLKGVNKAITTCELETDQYDKDTNLYYNYQAGFHFWLRKMDAEKYKKFLCDAGDFRKTDLEIIECIIKKEWVTATGTNDVGKRHAEKTIVANKAIFPECRKEGE